MKAIYLAGGCFWGTEHYMSQFEGVLQTEVGYANGDFANPTYQQVYTDKTGFVECVKVIYDESVIALETLLKLFFKSIDPLSVNRQGEDYGTRYRTGIYWEDPQDQVSVEQVYMDVQSGYDVDLAVEKGALKCFYSAEDYHQDYLVKNPEGYCHLSLETLQFAKRYSQITAELRSLSDDEKKVVLPKFFKTAKGEYGEGDRFMGVVVPSVRTVAKKFKNVSLDVVEGLLESEWHECRLCALLILREKFAKSPDEIAQFYLLHMTGINNWDLVDLSAPYILGTYLLERPWERIILYQLAGSGVLWERRIAIVSTLMLIRNGQYEDTLKLAAIFLQSEHDLMQKAVGWMLREVGKKDEPLLRSFLDRHCRVMPRTMLRYAIERLPQEVRLSYMK